MVDLESASLGLMRRAWAVGAPEMMAALLELTVLLMLVLLLESESALACGSTLWTAVGAKADAVVAMTRLAKASRMAWCTIVEAVSVSDGVRKREVWCGIWEMRVCARAKVDCRV